MHGLLIKQGAWAKKQREKEKSDLLGQIGKRTLLIHKKRVMLEVLSQI